MPSTRNQRLVLTAATAVAIALCGRADPGVAQTVFGSSTDAHCKENAGNGALACGSGATASPGTGAEAIGINAKATADAALAVGFNANAASISAIALGQGAGATNQGSIAVGQGAASTGSMSTAIGFSARALANDAVAIGDAATASGNSSTAVGANAEANFASSAALGSGAQTTAANQMTFGTPGNFYTLPGVNSAASKGAQKGTVKMLTVDANGNVAVAEIPSCRCAPPPPVKRQSR
jgi:hypothetical protein